MLLFVALFAATATTQPARDMPVFNPAPQAATCPETPMSLARKLGKGTPRAIPLSKLPPARTFMAVDRRIGGCPAPLTMVDYRNAARR
ncbi:MAG: hypothetical protein ACJ8FT_05600 [Sphingomonas sp.]